MGLGPGRGTGVREGGAWKSFCVRKPCPGLAPGHPRPPRGLTESPSSHRDPRRQGHGEPSPAFWRCHRAPLRPPPLPPRHQGLVPSGCGSGPPAERHLPLLPCSQRAGRACGGELSCQRPWQEACARTSAPLAPGPRPGCQWPRLKVDCRPFAIMFFTASRRPCWEGGQEEAPGRGAGVQGCRRGSPGAPTPDVSLGPRAPHSAGGEDTGHPFA